MKCDHFVCWSCNYVTLTTKEYQTLLDKIASLEEQLEVAKNKEKECSSNIQEPIISPGP